MDSHDFIQPAAIPGHGKGNEPALLPKSEYTFEHVKEVLQKIQHLCNARGEHIGAWMDSFMMMMKKEQVEFGRTWDVAIVLLTRLMRGEFLFLFSERSGLINALNPLFAPELLVVWKGKDESAIARSRRPALKDPKNSKLVLSDSTYFQARLPASSPLTKEEFKSAITAILIAFRGYHPELANEAKDWEIAVLDAGKDVGGKRWNFLGNKSQIMRWKLIVVGEKVRTGEKLPNVEDLLHGHIEPPRNVNSTDACFVHSETAHSLARISLRQARRIGYVGRVSEEGGMYF